jgi:hypothetical protein
MQITARFGSTCPACGGQIPVGATVEWEKGQKARHVVCPARGSAGAGSPARARTPSAPRRQAPRRPPFPSTPPEPGAFRIEGRRDGRRDERYSTGMVVHALKVREAGGGPDGHYYTVLCSGLFPPCEDNQQFDWQEIAWVRPATDAEAAPRAAQDAARELREALVRDLGALPGERVSGPMPEGSVVLVPRNGAKLCATGERVAIVDGAILHERVGDPDQCDSWYHYVVRVAPSPELLARVQAFVAAARAS